MIERLSPHEAAHDMEKDDPALLVCAYESDEQFEENQLEGAISLRELLDNRNEIAYDRELIFYCACPNEETAMSRAIEFEEDGFSNTKVLRGGVEEWKASGLPVS